MHGKRIIYIEDDPDILLIVEIILTEHGYEVMGFDHAPSVPHLCGLQPDLVLLDEWVGGVTGSGICKEIKGTAGKADVPVVLISAVSGLERIAEECGANFFIAKPFDLDYLVGSVKMFLK